jgi:hypothetical protein
MSDVMAKKHQRNKKPNVEEDKDHFQRTAGKKVAENPDENSAPADDAAGFGGEDTLNTNEAVLTTETGTPSQTERYVMASDYGVVLAPERLPNALCRCRVCGKLFSDMGAYGLHYRDMHK